MSNRPNIQTLTLAGTPVRVATFEGVEYFNLEDIKRAAAVEPDAEDHFTYGDHQVVSTITGDCSLWEACFELSPSYGVGLITIS